jgi:hypothetical protein
VTPPTVNNTQSNQNDAPKELTMWDLDDESFKEQLPKFVDAQKMPFDFRPFANFPCGHGHTAEGKPVTLLQHTLDVICGNFGGFGLNTSVHCNSLKPAQVKKVLRLVALFHDSGKTDGRKDHIGRSAEIAVKALSTAKDAWGVSDEEIVLIKHIILSNDLYGQYLKGSSKMSMPQLQEQLTIAYSNLQKECDLNITVAEFRKLMFAFWIADASTLKVVNRDRVDLYKPLFQEADKHDYDKLDGLENIKSLMRSEYLNNNNMQH